MTSSDGSTMCVFDAEHFELPRRLAAGIEQIRNEVEALPDSAFAPWPEREAYSHGWLIFPLVNAALVGHVDIDLAANRARCPATTSLLFDERIRTAGFSRLLPGCHIYHHRDTPEDRVMRFHLAINNDGSAGLRVGDHAHVWRRDRAIVFDHRIEHEAGNLGERARDAFLVDFLLDATDLATIARLKVRSASADDRRRP